MRQTAWNKDSETPVKPLFFWGSTNGIKSLPLCKCLGNPSFYWGFAVLVSFTETILRRITIWP